jgi:hypothetical protein
MVAEVPTFELKFDPHPLPPTRCNLPLCLTVWIPGLNGLDHIAQFLGNDSKKENHPLLIHWLVPKAAKIYWIAIRRPPFKACALLTVQTGKGFRHRPVHTSSILTGDGSRLR